MPVVSSIEASTDNRDNVRGFIDAEVLIGKGPDVNEAFVHVDVLLVAAVAGGFGVVAER